MYFSGSKAKLEIALAKGKKLYDKRNDLKEKVAKRDIEKSLKNYLLIWGCLGFDRGMFDLSCSRWSTLKLKQKINWKQTN